MEDRVRVYAAGTPASRSPSELNANVPSEALASDALCSRDTLDVTLIVCLLFVLNHCSWFESCTACVATSLGGGPPPNERFLIDVVPSGSCDATRTVPVG